MHKRGPPLPWSDRGTCQAHRNGGRQRWCCGCTRDTNAYIKKQGATVHATPARKGGVLIVARKSYGGEHASIVAGSATAAWCTMAINLGALSFVSALTRLSIILAMKLWVQGKGFDQTT